MSPRRFAKDDKSYDAALDRALTLLEYRARTANEMRRALLQREFDEETADAVVERLIQLGYIDDAAFADAIVRSSLRKGQGTWRAKRALYAHGVGEEQSAEALCKIDEDDELEAALAPAQKLWQRYEGCPPRERAARVSRALAGRGFGYDVISRALRQIDRGFDEED